MVGSFQPGLRQIVYSRDSQSEKLPQYSLRGRSRCAVVLRHLQSIAPAIESVASTFVDLTCRLQVPEAKSLSTVECRGAR